MRALFRLPKGVPAEIRRQLRRIASRRLPKPGQVLSYENALLLHDLLTFERQRLAKPLHAAVRALDKARRPETRQKWLEVVKAARGTAERLEHAVIQLERAEGIAPVPPLASRDVRPTIDTDFEGPDYLLPEEGALEWEVGVDYTEESGWSHRQGRTSDVSFNARLYRRDRRPMTESDVRAAIDRFVSTGDMPHGIAVRSVSWANWKGVASAKRGTVTDLENFQNILVAVGNEGLRIGGVKEDRL